MSVEGRRADIRLLGAAGGVLAGERQGSGTPLLLLHGLTATRRYVVQGSTLLARGGYELIAYDARGHGASDPAPVSTAYEYSDLVADLESVLAQLGLERVVLAGSSMGAATSLAFALAAPQRVAALVQITPAFAGAPRAGAAELAVWDARAAAMRSGDLDEFVARTGIAELPEQFREPARIATLQRAERHLHPTAVADALEVVPRSQAFASLDALDTLDVPVLVVGSRDTADPGHPLAGAQEYARRLPRATFVVEDEGKPPLAWQGAQLSRAIAEFLDAQA